MADTQRDKARSMMKECGYAAGGLVRVGKHMPRPHIQRPSAAGPATMPQGAPQMGSDSLGAAPGVPGAPPQFKKGGKVAKYAKGGAVKKMDDHDEDDKPRHIAKGGVKKMATGGGLGVALRKEPTKPPGTAKVKSRGKDGQSGG